MHHRPLASMAITENIAVNKEQHLLTLGNIRVSYAMMTCCQKKMTKTETEMSIGKRIRRQKMLANLAGAGQNARVRRGEHAGRQGEWRAQHLHVSAQLGVCVDSQEI